MPRRFPTRWDLLIALSLLFLIIAHYSLSTHALWIHGVLFWFFQVPVLIGATTRGVRGGLAVAVAATAAMLPHAVGLTRHHGLSANMIWMDLTSLYIIGLTAGWLRDARLREQIMGERFRELRRLRQILRALRGDLGASTDAMRGVLVSLDPLQDRVPGLSAALRALDRSLGPLETLSQRTQVLRVEPKVTIASLEWIVSATRAQLDRIQGPAPYLLVDWRCAPPMLPGSVRSLGSALAACALHLTPAVEVCLMIRKSPGWVQIDISPVAPALEAPGGSRPVAAASFELACQIIRAHGGRVESELALHRSAHLRISLPTSLRIQPFPREPEGVVSADAVFREGGTAQGEHFDGYNGPEQPVLPGLGSRPTDGFAVR